MEVVELEPYGEVKRHGRRNAAPASDESPLDDVPLIADGDHYVSDDDGQWKRRPARQYGSLSWSDQISGYSERYREWL